MLAYFWRRPHSTVAKQAHHHFVTEVELVNSCTTDYSGLQMHMHTMLAAHSNRALKMLKSSSCTASFTTLLAAHRNALLENQESSIHTASITSLTTRVTLPISKRLSCSLLKSKRQSMNSSLMCKSHQILTE